MAGTLTVTRDPKRFPYSGRNAERIVVDWTSDASGNADVSIENMYGWCVKVLTDPGSTAPTDNYDITLLDENGFDALESKLVDRDTANKETVYPLVTGAATPVFLCGTHTFTVANAGNAKVGRAIFYIVESL
jgi:hypothetical protein